MIVVGVAVIIIVIIIICVAAAGGKSETPEVIENAESTPQAP